MGTMGGQELFLAHLKFLVNNSTVLPWALKGRSFPPFSLQLNSENDGLKRKRERVGEKEKENNNNNKKKEHPLHQGAEGHTQPGVSWMLTGFQTLAVHIKISFFVSFFFLEFMFSKILPQQYSLLNPFLRVFSRNTN